MKVPVIGFAVLLFAISAGAADTGRKHIVMKRPAGASTLPFSDAVLVGDTLYLGGHLGLDPKTGQAPADIEEEVKLVMGGVKQTLEAGGMTMDDLVSVQVFCSDLSLYETFNGIYKGFFSGEYPARAFLGSGKLLRGAHFEVMGIAIKASK